MKKKLEPDKPKRKMTHAEAGRLGGLIGGKIGGKIGGRISRGGGRPRKYHTETERRAARVRDQQKYIRRKNRRKTTPSLKFSLSQ